MNYLNFLKEISENRSRYAKIVILWSILIFSTLSMVAFTETIKQRSIEPYVKAQYDYKFTGLINNTIMENLLKEDYIEDVAFVLISDIKLNDKRVAAALISDVKKANLTIYNPSILKSGSFEKYGVVIDEELAKNLGLSVGESVVVTPIYSDYKLNLKVSGIAYSTTSTHAGVFMEYPEIFKKYFSSRLPMNATYGEAYIKFKSGDKKLYAKYVSEIVDGKGILRSDKIRELSSYYEREFGNPLALILIHSGIFMFTVLLLKESMTYAKRKKKVYRKLMKFGYSARLLSQYLLNLLIIVTFSTVLALLYLIIFCLYFGLDLDSLSVLLLIPMTLVASLLIFYGMIKVS